MARIVRIGDRLVGDDQPVFITAEIGINHNGDIQIAKKLIDAALDAGCDAVKFQKRTPEVCVPYDQQGKMRQTPWGDVTYLEYRKRVELSEEKYQEIDSYCRERGIIWFASCWDIESIDFMEKFNPPVYKVPSAMLTNVDLLRRIRASGRCVVLSTGMSTMEEIQRAVKVLNTDQLILNHCTSSYPSPVTELNLRVIQTLQQEFNCPIGYSGHEVGLPTTIAATALGACYIERHITLDRAMWGSDHAASVEPEGFKRLVMYIRGVEKALGDGIKKLYDSEQSLMERLRKVNNLSGNKEIK